MKDWYAFMDKAEHLIIRNGITGIGFESFVDFGEIEKRRYGRNNKVYETKNMTFQNREDDVIQVRNKVVVFIYGLLWKQPESKKFAPHVQN